MENSNRTIKFRVWDGHTKSFFGTEGTHYLPRLECDIDGLLTLIPVDNTYKIMQFTGLRDNTKWEELTKKEQQVWLENHTKEEWKGKEIYEDDLVLVGLRDKRIYRIYYDLHSGYMGAPRPNKEYGWGGSYLEEFGKLDMNFVKVIGNIYSNPELLK